MANAKRFIEVGFPPRLAVELTNQINASTGNKRRLTELGMTPSLAALVASTISGGTYLVNALAELGLPGRQNRELKAQISTSTGTPTPPAGFAFVTTNNGADYVTTNNGADRVLAKVA